jgi:hypothetical protein
MPFIALALVIAAALGGGTAALAQTSLPGDALWGFKVHVNEGVAGALSASDEAKANWDLTAIKSRVAEAQKLSQKGKLSADAQATIAANIQTHADGLSSTITKLQADGDTKGAATIAAQYQAELAAAADTNLNTNANTDASVQMQGDANLDATVHSALEAASSLSASVNAAVR